MGVIMKPSPSRRLRRKAWTTGRNTAIDSSDIASVWVESQLFLGWSPLSPGAVCDCWSLKSVVNNPRPNKNAAGTRSIAGLLSSLTLPRLAAALGRGRGNAIIKVTLQRANCFTWVVLVLVPVVAPVVAIAPVVTLDEMQDGNMSNGMI